MMLRNLFVREEEGALVMGSGLRPEWLARREPMGIERTLTPFGTVSLRLTPNGATDWQLALEAKWHRTAPRIEIAVPGYAAHSVSDQTFSLRRKL